MKDLKTAFAVGGIVSVGLIILAIEIFCIKALVLWGIANLVCYVFGISFYVTFGQAFAASLVIWILKGIFRPSTITTKE